MVARPHCYVYVLGCVEKARPRTYVGWTTDLERRLAGHNAGTAARTTRGATWHLLYAEPWETQQAAMSREWHLKRDRVFRRRLLEHAIP
ncbi:MAG: GIY-YIG nuclease family protein [Alphaproteobacteria bacterium]|nr:GIY-YIG nuclease family protein [Alphaproteobacteria bacterium]